MTPPTSRRAPGSSGASADHIAAPPMIEGWRVRYGQVLSAPYVRTMLTAATLGRLSIGIHGIALVIAALEREAEPLSLSGAPAAG